MRNASAAVSLRNSPDRVEFSQGAQLGIGRDQRRTVVQCRGTDQPIGWIAVLEQRAAREQRNLRRDRQHIKPQGCQQLAQVVAGRHILWQQQAAAFV